MNYTHAYSLREGMAELAQLPSTEDRTADLGQDELQPLVSDEEILERAASALAFQEQQNLRSTSGPLHCSDHRRLQLRRQDISR